MKELDIKMKFKTLLWDQEYWEGYIRQYRSGEIQCDTQTQIKDILDCEEQLKKVIEEQNRILNDHAEEFL